jgi:hypothetical protein
MRAVCKRDAGIVERTATFGSAAKSYESNAKSGPAKGIGGFACCVGCWSKKVVGNC